MLPSLIAPEFSVMLRVIYLLYFNRFPTTYRDINAKRELQFRCSVE